MPIFHPAKRTDLFLNKSFATLIICLAILVPALMQCNPAGAAIRPVVITGDEAPEMGADSTYIGIDNIAINNSGQSTFTASVESGGTNYYTLWRENTGTTELIAREGENAPGISGDARFNYFSFPIINDAGLVAFFGKVEEKDNGSTSYSGVWKGAPGSLSMTACEGDIAPGTDNHTFGNFSANNSLSFNNSGQVVFTNRLRGEGAPDGGMWQESASVLTLVYKTGDPAPGYPDATYLNVTPINLLRDNEVVFRSDITVPWFKELDWTDQKSAELIQQKTINGSLATKYKSWTAAPGVADGVFWNFYLQRGSMNASGQLVFAAKLYPNGSVNNTNQTGIWSDASGRLALVARQGSHAPGTPAGAVFKNFNSDIAISDSGQVAFMSQLTIGEGGVDAYNNSGIWIETDGDLKLLARTGDHAPGTPDGTIFQVFTTGAYGFNSAGQFFFAGMMKGSSGNVSTGIWLYDSAAGVSLIVSDGDQVTLTTGETVTFSSITTPLGVFGNNTGGSDGRARSFNNSGEIAFRANLSDYRQGFFIANTNGSGSGGGGNGGGTEPQDNDGDGVSSAQGDCNDNDNTIYPGAIEICGDGIDQDCNGSDLPCMDPPSKPTGVEASDGTFSGKIAVEWDAAKDATSYDVYRADMPAWTGAKMTRIATSVAGTSYDDTGAVTGRRYYYWVKAKNSGGASKFSAFDTGYWGSTGKAPARPTDTDATDGAGSVTVTWTAVADTLVYEIWRADIPAFLGGKMKKIGTTDATSYEDTTAVSGSQYYYWVKARNSWGISRYSLFDTGYVGPKYNPPAAPTNVEATDGFPLIVTITWKASPGTIIYEIWRAEETVANGGRPVRIGTADDDEFAFIDTSMDWGKTYYYWVKARNSWGSSPYSKNDTGYCPDF